MVITTIVELYRDGEMSKFEKLTKFQKTELLSQTRGV